jgi:hypothetical protein
MFLEVLSQTYHIPITIDSPLRGVFPCIPRCSSHSFLSRGATDERPLAIHGRETPMLSADASDTGLVSVARRQFSQNDYVACTTVSGTAEHRHDATDDRCRMTCIEILCSGISEMV